MSNETEHLLESPANAERLLESKAAIDRGEVKVRPLIDPSNIVILGPRDSAISLFFNLDNEMSFLINKLAPEHDVETISEAIEYAEDLIFNLKELKKELAPDSEPETEVHEYTFEHEGSFSIDFNPWIVIGVMIPVLAAAYVLGAYLRHLMGF